MSARRTGAASAAALLAVALSAVGVDACVGLGDCLGLSAREELRLHQADAAVIEAQRVRVIRENERTARAAARVADGTLPLAAAVDEVEPVHRARPGVGCAWASDPPPTFRHGVARSVLTRAGVELKHDSLRRAAVLARLDAEYAALR